jgi:FkbM family methyltransferase
MSSTYLNTIFTDRIHKDSIKTIVECGSRDCLDAIELLNYYQPDVIYSFECNPESVLVCDKNIKEFSSIKLIPKAVCDVDEKVDFYATDMERSNDKNIGASSLLFHIDNEYDYIQKRIRVQGIRLDSFMKQEQIQTIDLLCLDLQGAEKIALEGLGDQLKNVRYIISEVSFSSYYYDNVLFTELTQILKDKGFIMTVCDHDFKTATTFGNALFENARMTKFDFIQGERFIELADDKKIFYCATHDFSKFFSKLPTTDAFVLITHNSDHNIHTGYKIPDNLIHWFAQNVNRVDSRIESLPIGLENDKWQKKVNKIQIMELLLAKPRKFKNFVYMNHNIGTNPIKRIPPYRILEGKSWITTERGTNGYKFENYLNNVYSHPFVICPEGHGIDTVRTWECLYMGTIPIEKRNINNQFYTDLPILFVDDWSELNLTMLQDEYERITHTNWNLKKLEFSYWKNKILSYVK